jgi:p-cumate 2,3-dioxygenase alpha subunit
MPDTLSTGAASLVPSGLIKDDPASGKFRVARKAFLDPRVLEQERAAIFDRCWLYLGHESELSERNDFLTRDAGGRSIIFNRDRAGNFRAFLNVCPHRGAPVVREKTGNAISFKCFYHGWAFNNNGNCAMRFPPGTYPENFNADGCANLIKVPRLEQHRGMYFVNFDVDACSLAEYLGPKVIDVLDIVLDHSAAGMEIIGGTQEYSIKANWKLLVENSFDGYHAQETHSTYLEYLAEAIGGPLQVLPGAGRESRVHDLGNGHAVIEYPAPWGRPVAQWIPAWGEQGKSELTRIEANLIAQHGAARAGRITSLNRNMVIFPNLVVNDIMAITIRTFYPERPDYMTINGWALGPKDETAIFRKYRLSNFLEFLGPGGFATPDDVEALEGCQRGYQSTGLTGFNDLSKGMLKPQPASDDEEQMRVFWREWRRRIEAAGAGEPA